MVCCRLAQKSQIVQSGQPVAGLTSDFFFACCPLPIACGLFFCLLTSVSCPSSALSALKARRGGSSAVKRVLLFLWPVACGLLPVACCLWPRFSVLPCCKPAVVGLRGGCCFCSWFSFGFDFDFGF